MKTKEDSDTTKAGQSPNDGGNLESKLLTEFPRELALRIYASGYRAGHHDTVEGGYIDDPRGNDSEYYHGDAVSELLSDFKINTTRFTHVRVCSDFQPNQTQ